MVGSEHSLINFEKRRKVATVLTRLQQVRSSRVIPSSSSLLAQFLVEDGTYLVG